MLYRKKQFATFFITLAVTLCFSVSTAKSTIQNNKVGDQKIIVEISSRSDLAILRGFGAIVDRRTMRRGLVSLYVNEISKQEIIQAGFTIYDDYQELPGTEFDKSLELKGYRNHSELTSDLKRIVAKYPHIFQLSSIGKSVRGRELWVVKVSDNVSYDEAEPEFKYISTMHGNEVLGQPLMIMLLEYLGENYQKNPRITYLIDNTEIWIMPNMNPDGTASRRRSNARYVDLNRNFPDHSRGDLNSFSGRAMETKHMMKFTASRNFVLSANFHGGALVINYPWDSEYVRMPDNDVAIAVSLAYSSKNPAMYNSYYYENGITNGYDWYSISGGMQDWNYAYHNCLDVTVELHDIKWPSYSMIEAIWNDNRESLINYIEQVHIGVHGTIVDSITKGPSQNNLRFLIA